MGDDTLSIRHWLYKVTGIPTESLAIPKDFERPMWFAEEPIRLPEPCRPDAYREKVTLNIILLAKDAVQLKSVVRAVRQDLADRGWVLPLFNEERQQVGYLRECRPTFGKPDGLDQTMELKCMVYIPYTPIEYDPLLEFYSRYDPVLRKGGTIE
ncbi:hypothetical protein P4S93_09245 [Aneurinibacillus thermoaerophilus]|uniref:Uncharacterized protein n=1 Tax=Aneurinibacillus thermoaerophilus TaxID=143495 RepID=A0ABX8Y713_ANETH|nr:MULTISPECIES: hypothetical protein [Aneurinibacillus]AMA72773.1 hypothetical protein ACH33_07840 [Aneurinibacillus sp. XH2]MED0675792.1 hypothetical protein [Aneurinibacillus thermoaerophilus]MED0756913.1 hypothetical protein [Aneurinibacillus thermoaerophilus]MED0760963.1 hypothetical protein [Aneurinibacillus thermoaerophilus]QYY41463.1 hypothetical protein K3F53_10975 [Aneurinibacillus thermoaerophilus]